MSILELIHDSDAWHGAWEGVMEDLSYALNADSYDRIAEYIQENILYHFCDREEVFSNAFLIDNSLEIDRLLNGLDLPLFLSEPQCFDAIVRMVTETLERRYPDIELPPVPLERPTDEEEEENDHE